MTITILADDTPHPQRTDLSSKHGFSLHAAMENRNILYDFGSAGALAQNAAALNVPLDNVDTAVLSHGHYDHTGGITDFLKINTHAPVYHGVDAFQPRWSVSGRVPREVGSGLNPSDPALGQLTAVSDITYNSNVDILPAAPGLHKRPSHNASLLSGPGGSRMQDEFTDELTMVLHGKSGLVVVSGCSHRGILNIADQVNTYCEQCPITALIGGFHLIDDFEDPREVKFMAEYLKKTLPDTRIMAGHCTGKKAMKMFRKVMGKQLEPLHVGMVLDIP